MVWAPEQIEQIRERSRRWRKEHPEHTAKLAALSRGRVFSEETRKKMREAKVGKALSLEHRRKLSEGMRGYRHSEEHKLNESEAKLGAKNPAWKGGVSIDRLGYRRLPTGLGRRDTALEHRAVMEKHLGRNLGRQEVVHHINGDPADNRIENLLVFSCQAKHLAHHRKHDKNTVEQHAGVGAGV